MCVILFFPMVLGKDLPYEASGRDSGEAAGYDGNTKPLLYDHSVTEYAAVDRNSESSYIIAEAHKARTPSSASALTGSSILSRSTTASGAASSDLEAHAVVSSPLVAGVSAMPLLHSTSGSRHSSMDGKDRTASTDKWQVFPEELMAEHSTNYSRAELTARTPWMQFLTHPVARSLLLCSFCYVSYSMCSYYYTTNIIIFVQTLSTITALYLLFILIIFLLLSYNHMLKHTLFRVNRAGSASPCSQRCPLTLPTFWVSIWVPLESFVYSPMQPSSSLPSPLLGSSTSCREIMIGVSILCVKQLCLLPLSAVRPCF